MSNPPLWSLLNEAYLSIFPEPQKSMGNAMIQAMGCGALASYAVVWAVEKASELIDNHIQRGFDDRFTYELERIIMYGAPLFAMSELATHSNATVNLMMNHPVYAAGLVGAYLAESATCIFHGITIEEKSVSENSKTLINCG